MARQNGISVEDLLKIDIMGSSEVIAGFRGVRNTISRVNIMADPDILQWTRSGEFLLSTGYFFGTENIEEQKELILQCSRKKLAGIGIKISPYLDSLPKDLIELANDLSFPIVDIHHSIPLADIMMTAFKEIFNKQASLLERIELAHERFMEAMLKESGPKEIGKIVHENLKNPVVLHLNLNKESTEFFQGLDESTKEELRQEVNKFYLGNNKLSKSRKLDESKVLIAGKFVKRMVIPIILRDGVYGHIFSWSLNMPLGGFDLSILESASTTIALCVLQELTIKEVEIRYRSEFFEDLISPDLKRRNKALERSMFFNLDPSLNYIVEVMSFRFKNMESEKEDIEYIQDFINKLVYVVEDLMVYYGIKGLVSTRLKGIQILLSTGEKEDRLAELEDLNQSIIDHIDKKHRSVDINIGIGRNYSGLDQAQHSFHDAVRAIRMGKILMEDRVTYFQDLGIFKILSEDSLTGELEDFYNSTLKPLVEYDKKKSTELVKTLDVYFQNNGNLTRMSEQLFTHYNTVLYRINRIGQITNMDLENSHHRLNLEIAIKIKELLGK